MQSKNTTNILLVVAIGILLFGSGYRLGEFSTRQSSTSFGNQLSVFGSTSEDVLQNNKNIDFSLFWNVWNKIETKYVDKSKVDKQKMYYGAIQGMVASVEDPYTFFLTPDQNKQSKDDLGGKFEGIGAQLGLKDNRIVVIAPIKDSPAIKAGVQPGDFILKVNNESVKGWTLTQAVSKIRGEKGTKVSLTLERNSKEISLDITRDQIHVASVEVTYETNTDCSSNCQTVANLKLNKFGQTTTDEWETSVREIAQKWKNKEIAGMVLDVRYNPGGYLEGAVYIASEFLPKGKVVVKQESTVNGSKIYNVEREGMLLDIPLTVIINGGSASASEILAGALRDHNRAKLIGEKSFGKGSVQEALDLTNGAGLHVTVAKWILPKGDWIMGKGIEPQIKVTNVIKEGETLQRADDAQLNKAIEIATQ
ncbi:MAG: S41 family peptidase [Candidatus Roizmanbacteria bacterium]